MKELWTFTTDFGDTAVTLPLAFLVAACLILLRQPRTAIRWSLVIGGCGMTVLLLKLLLRSCALISPSGHAAMSIIVYGGLTLLIAHSKSSGVNRLWKEPSRNSFWGPWSPNPCVGGEPPTPSISLIILKELEVWRLRLQLGAGKSPLRSRVFPHPVKILAVAAVTLLVAAIALSRLALAAHSLGEITLGLLVGAAWLGGFWRMQRRQTPFDLRLPWLMAACALAIAILHGMNWPVEIALGKLVIQFPTCR